MAEKFTTGPWEHKGHQIVSTTSWFLSPKDAIGQDIEPIPTSIVNLIGAMGGNDTTADARLIAAAPELYEALSDLRWHSVGENGMDFEIKVTCWQVDRIIKALGKASDGPISKSPVSP